jgi:cobalt/nickel transport system permease protein
MHIPDGFLANRVALALNAVSITNILYAAHRLRNEASTRMIPLMGVLSAFVFAAQMLNFPVLGGTSGHLVGGALLAILLGPMAGFLTMVTVILAQALFLQDGGLIALGANIFNIGAMTTFSGYLIFRLLGGEGKGKRMIVAGFIAGWGSLMMSAASCAIQLGMSGAIPLNIGLPAMAGYYAIIGIVEGGLTAGILAFLVRVRPDLLNRDARPKFGLADWSGASVLIGVPALILILWGGSALPDPLQKLLPASQTAGDSGEIAQSIISAMRFRDYFILALTFIAILAAAYFIARITKKRSH